MKQMYVYDDMAKEIESIAADNNLMEVEVMDMLMDYIKEMCEDNDLKYKGDAHYYPLYPN